MYQSHTTATALPEPQIQTLSGEEIHSILEEQKRRSKTPEKGASNRLVRNDFRRALADDVRRLIPEEEQKRCTFENAPLPETLIARVTPRFCCEADNLILSGSPRATREVAAAMIDGFRKAKVDVLVAEHRSLLNRLAEEEPDLDNMLEAICTPEVLFLLDFDIRKLTALRLELTRRVISARTWSRRPMVLTTVLSDRKLRFPSDPETAWVLDPLMMRSIVTSVPGNRL